MEIFASIDTSDGCMSCMIVKQQSSLSSGPTEQVDRSAPLQGCFPPFHAAMVFDFSSTADIFAITIDLCLIGRHIPRDLLLGFPDED
jgi:hypothetical protein